MPWPILIELIAKYGVPLAFKLAEKWNKKDAVTTEELAELMILANQTARSQLIDSLQRNGISLDSPQAVALLAMTPA